MDSFQCQAIALWIKCEFDTADDSGEGKLVINDLTSFDFIGGSRIFLLTFACARVARISDFSSFKYFISMTQKHSLHSTMPTLHQTSGLFEFVPLSVSNRSQKKI
jgi:hypothetical protein